MKKYSKLISCIVILFIFIFTTFILKRYFKPFIWIIILLFLSNPINNLLNKNNLFNKKINSLLSVVFVNLILLILVFTLWGFIFRKVNVFLNSNFSNIFFSKNSLLNEFNQLVDLKTTIKEIKSIFYNIYDNEIIKKSAFYTIEEMLAFFVANIIVYFTISDTNKITYVIKQLITDSNYKLLKNKLEVINKIIKLELVFVVITTLETILGFIILHLNYSIVLGIICGILDFIPYVGTIIIFLPLIIYKLYLKDYYVAFGLIILYIILIIARQIMEAKYMSSKFHIHPILIIVSFYIGIKYFGILGLFIGPLYILTVKEFVFSQ